MATAESMAPKLEHYVPDHVPPELVKPFDIFDSPGMHTNPYETVYDLRRHGRVFWNPTNTYFRGSWVLTRAEDLREVLSHPEMFSSRGTAGFMMTDEDSWDLIPLNLDPPAHTKFRKLLNPLLSPPAVAKLVDGVYTRATELIENVRARGECDFLQSFAIPYPVSIFMQMMGLPREDMPELLKWEALLVHSGEIAADSSAVDEASRQVLAYLGKQVADRRQNPQNDIITKVANATIDGRPLRDKEVEGILYLLFLAGLDSITASLGWIFHHLAENPDQQQQLRDNPDLIPRAIEEMLRRHSINTMHRRCMQDVEVAGVQMKKGDWITFSAALASTDPEEFKDPMKVDFDRQNVRHLAFGFGPHFCLGSHLARRELEVALQEWLSRVPTWRIKPRAELETHAGHAFGYKSLPIEWKV